MLAGRPGPSEGSSEPEWCSEGKIASGMTNGLDFKEVCFQAEEGLTALGLPRSAES